MLRKPHTPSWPLLVNFNFQLKCFSDVTVPAPPNPLSKWPVSYARMILIEKQSVLH